MKKIVLSLFVLLSIGLIAQENFTNRDIFISQADERLAPFYHGVASGDPLPDRVIIWTRVTPSSNEDVTVNYQMATDVEMKNVVKSGSFITNSERDFTVKIDVDGLTPATHYYYQFEAFGKKSVIGRTKTAPQNDSDYLRFGIVSCANYQNGYFNAFRKLAERKDLDAVIHLGDYLYEYGSSSEDRPHVPENEIISLADYRARHSHYKLDPDLRYAHAQNPWIMVWDDHETTNNSYKDGAENHTEGTEGNWEERKQLALQAYYEWQPIRLPDNSNFTRIWRSFSYGNLADIVMLDTRIYGREEQLSDAAIAAGSDINSDERQMLGTDQLDFLKFETEMSDAKWKILGQQVMMTQLNVLGLPTAEEIPVLGDILTELVKEGGIAINADAWDGYPKERERVLKHLADNEIDNSIVLTGDIHTSWAADLHWDISNPLKYNPITGGSVAVEFVTPSITSSNADAIDPSAQSAPLVHAVIQAANPHIKYVDMYAHGYMILDLDETRAQNDWYYVDNIATPGANENFGAGYFTNDGENRVQSTSTPVDRGNKGPALTPEFPSNTTNITENANTVILGVYPNPIKDAIQINMISNKSGDYQFSLLHLNGKEVLDLGEKYLKTGPSNVKFNLNDLTQGVYFLSINGVESSSVYKIVKQ